MKVNGESVALSAAHGSEGGPLFRVRVEAFRAQGVASQRVAVHVVPTEDVDLKRGVKSAMIVTMVENGKKQTK